MAMRARPWSGVGPELVGHFLSPLGLETQGHNSCLLSIGFVFDCACVCTEWSTAVSTAVEGVLVPPITLQSVIEPEEPAYGSKDRRKRALKYKSARMQATVESLAWCLHRFPRTRGISVVGWTGSIGSIQERVLIDQITMCTHDDHFREGEWPWVTDMLAMSLASYCPRLESLRGSRVAKEGLSQMAVARLAEHCPNLQYIDLSGLRAPAGLVRRRSFKLFPPRLVSIDLSFVEWFDNDTLKSLALHSSELKFLSLSHTKVADAGIDFLSQGGMPNLIGLDIGGLTISRDTLEGLLNSDVIRRSRALNLYCQEIRPQDLNVLAERCPELSELQLGHDADVGQHGPEDLVMFLGATRNRLLSFNVGPIFNDAVARAVAHNCPRLRWFVAGFGHRNTLTDGGLSAVLGSCKRLEVLDVCGSEQLSLFGRQWSQGPACFARLLASKGQHLKWMSVHGCSFRALSLLRKRLPATIFDHDGCTDFLDIDYVDIEPDDSLMASYDVVTGYSTDSLSDSGDPDTWRNGPVRARAKAKPTAKPRARPGAKAKAKAKPKAKTKSRAKAKATPRSR